jgi:hypothetical protein
MPGPQLQPEEEFEDGYTLKFEVLVQGRGLLVNFRRDRARIDVGIMLNQLGTPMSRSVPLARSTAVISGSDIPGSV